jgi:hypothetical protein
MSMLSKATTEGLQLPNEGLARKQSIITIATAKIFSYTFIIVTLFLDYNDLLCKPWAC